MAEPDRICPLCENITRSDVCPHDGVPTVERSMFEEQDEAIKPGVTVAGRCRVEELLGKGAMGSVFRGIQVSMNRQVAIKTLQKVVDVRGMGKK